MVDKLNNLSVLVGSINKVINNAATKGVIRVKELYLINLVYKLIVHQSAQGEITPCIMKLNSLYYQILNKYSYLCKAKLKKLYELSSDLNPTFDAYIPDPIDLNLNIYYWQENSTQLTIEEIKDLANPVYYKTKQKDSVTNFKTGITLSFPWVGRIAFVDPNGGGVDYDIRDAMGNEISNLFTITSMNDSAYTLFVSNRLYIPTNIFIKIKKN